MKLKYCTEMIMLLHISQLDYLCITQIKYTYRWIMEWWGRNPPNLHLLPSTHRAINGKTRNYDSTEWILATAATSVQVQGSGTERATVQSEHKFQSELRAQASRVRLQKCFSLSLTAWPSSCLALALPSFILCSQSPRGFRAQLKTSSHKHRSVYLQAVLPA